jgi:hypothetical protein
VRYRFFGNRLHAGMQGLRAVRRSPARLLVAAAVGIALVATGFATSRLIISCFVVVFAVVMVVLLIIDVLGWEDAAWLQAAKAEAAMHAHARTRASVLRVIGSSPSSPKLRRRCRYRSDQCGLRRPSLESRSSPR